MDPNSFPQLQLWCPRPFSTFTPTTPYPDPTASSRTPFTPPFHNRTENTTPCGGAAPDDGRVLLDTWYVIKPGNTKEKVAFFVAHQCGSRTAATTTTKLKGEWSGHGSKAKRRRRCRGAEETPDAVSVAEMVALVERRAALALHNLPAAPPSANDCNRVAEAVANFEARHRRQPPPATARPNGVCHPATDCTATPSAEVRIAFRIAGAREPPAGAVTTAVTDPGCRAKAQITCDLYRLVTPSRHALPANVELLLASKGDGTADDSTPSPSPPPPGRDCGGAAGGGGFHVDVVVTGAVDQCVFYGKDSAKRVTEETVRLPVVPDSAPSPPPPPPPPPPPGQLFLLPIPEDAEAEAEAVPPEQSLCRLYRHVSHEFLEIRFKIQRLLEPRQYMLLLPEHVALKILAYLPTRALAALKCSCHHFKALIETFGVRGADSRWSRDPLYRDDPCKQCRKRYERGDVSLCRWHPKPYHHDLPYGRSYWMCCRRPDKEAPGCRVGLHDNNWVQPRREDGR